MKIFSVSQIRRADEFTIQHEPIPSIDLMERAARACYNWFHNNVNRQKHIAIFCGKGNNGGDGLALARMLSLAGYQFVHVFIVQHSPKASDDFTTNYTRIKNTRVKIHEINAAKDVNGTFHVYVDAILGSGLNNPLRGLIGDVVDKINKEKGEKIAIDIPTGLFADSNADNSSAHIFSANHTLSFQFPKWSFLFPEFGPFAGKIHVLDIGLSKKFINQEPSPNKFIDEDMVKTMLPNRTKFDHKGTFGHAVLISGSKGKIGAAILATKAALKSGAGLVTAYLPKCGLIPTQAANPEIMALLDDGEDCIEKIKLTVDASAVGIGPGLGTGSKTSQTLLNFLENSTKPLVLDADALNIIAQNNAMKLVPKDTILTPHIGELSRLFGEKIKGEAVYEFARNFAQEHKVILLVKGAHTAIYTPEGNVYFNSSGTNGMATAGSGDVLTGVITGLMAQGLSPKNAAIIGVYFHGKAGELAAKLIGDSALTAGDLIENLKIC